MGITASNFKETRRILLNGNWDPTLFLKQKKKSVKIFPQAEDK